MCRFSENKLVKLIASYHSAATKLMDFLSLQCNESECSEPLKVV